MFVPFTGGKLKKTLQELEDSMMKYSTVGRVKIVERAGATLAHSILNQTPWSSETCGRIGCKPCVAKPGSCKKKNLTYTIQCIPCKTLGIVAKYHGESSRTFWDRSRDHENALKNHNTKYAVVVHWDQFHPEMEVAPEYTYKVSRVCQTSLERQMWEAMEIQDSDTQIVMNQKGEWGSNLPPSQVTTVGGEIWDQSGDKGKKRSGGRPPEPLEQPPDEHQQSMTVNQFQGQYRQRKKRKLAERALAELQKENGIDTHDPSFNNRLQSDVRYNQGSLNSDTRRL